MPRKDHDPEHDRDVPMLKIEADPIEALRALMETGTGENDPRREAERHRRREADKTENDQP